MCVLTAIDFVAVVDVEGVIDVVTIAVVIFDGVIYVVAVFDVDDNISVVVAVTVGALLMVIFGSMVVEQWSLLFLLMLSLLQHAGGTATVADDGVVST